jgi:hypothetical protein
VWCAARPTPPALGSVKQRFVRAWDELVDHTEIVVRGDELDRD